MNPASEKTSGCFPGQYATLNYYYNYIAQVKHEGRQECH